MEDKNRPSVIVAAQTATTTRIYVKTEAGELSMLVSHETLIIQNTGGLQIEVQP